MVKTTPEMGSKANMQNLLRRCWRSLCEMEEWKLTVVLFISNLSLWAFWVLVLPCTPSLLAILGLGIFMTWWPHRMDKGTSAGKSSRTSRRKDPTGDRVPWEGVEGSTKSLKAEWGKLRGGGKRGRESSCSGEVASARELPREGADVAQGGRFSADTSSELLRDQPSTANMQELARSLMASLDITEICLDLLGELKKTRHSSTPIPRQAMQKEYLVCLQCRRCLAGGCPHCSEPAAGQDLPTLATVLHTADILVHEEDLQLELGLGFELAIDGEPVYAWETTQRLPKIAPERCCKNCNAPLPRSPGDSQSSQASHPVLRPRRTQKGETRRARQDARAPARAERRDTSSADLQPAGQEDSLPTAVPTCPPSSSSAVLEQLRSAGKEALPSADYRGLGQRFGLQHISQSWQNLKASVQRKIGDELDDLLAPESSEPSGTTEGKQMLRFNLRSKVDALFDAATMEA